MRGLVVLLALAAPAYAGDEKDPGTALELSAGGVLATTATIGIGVGMFKSSQAGSTHELGTKIIVVGLASSFVTPSLGHWYSDSYFTTGMGIRTLSIATAVLGVAYGACDHNTDGGSSPGCSSGQQTIGGTMVAVGAIGYVVGIAYDVGTARGAARRYNDAHAATVVPTALAGPGSTGYGLAIVGRF